MKSILWLLLVFFAASNAAPVGILRQTRCAVKVEVTAASTSQFTNKAVAMKANCLDATIYGDAFGPATHNMAVSTFFVDSSHRKPASDVKIVSNGGGSSDNRDSKRIHRISLIGVRDLVAVVMLGFVVISAFACYCLRR